MGGVNLNNIKDYLEIIFYAVAIVSAIPLGKVIIYLVEKYQKRVKIYAVNFDDGKELLEDGPLVCFKAKNLNETPQKVTLYISDTPYNLTELRSIKYDNITTRHYYSFRDKDILYADLIAAHKNNQRLKFHLTINNTPKKYTVSSKEVMEDFKKKRSELWQKYIEEQQTLNNKTEVSETSISYI